MKNTKHASKKSRKRWSRPIRGATCHALFGIGNFLYRWGRSKGPLPLLYLKKLLSKIKDCFFIYKTCKVK